MLRGNVGIGTASPGYKLDVEGGQVNTSGGYCIGGICISSWPTANSGLPQVNGNSQVNGVLQVSGNTNPTTTAQGGYFGCNALTGSAGETNFINNQGYGTGGFAFFNTSLSASPRSLLMMISGSVGIGTQIPGNDLATLSTHPASTTPVFEVNDDIALTQGNGGQMFYPDGTVQSTAWNGTALGGDYAEAVDFLGDRTAYESGDVIVIDDTADGKIRQVG